MFAINIFKRIKQFSEEMSTSATAFKFAKETKKQETKDVKPVKEVKQPKKPVTTDTESDADHDVVLENKPVEVEKKKVRKPRVARNNIFKPVGVKRPSLYTVFVKEYFTSLPNGADKSVSQAAKEYSKIKDDDAKMAKYRETYARLLQEYNNEYESQKQAAIDRGDFAEKKKRPMSAYMLFATSAEVRAHAKKHSLSVTDTARYSGAQWKAMSDSEKDKYNKLAIANKEAFAAAEANTVVHAAIKKDLKDKKTAAPVKLDSDVTTTDASSASESESATAASDSEASSSSKVNKNKKNGSKSSKKQSTIAEEND